MMTEAYIGLGSNMGNAEEQLLKAIMHLAEHEGIHVAAFSPIYWTEPQDMPDQPWFANGVARLHCDDTWTAQLLLELLLRVEADLGRIRTEDPAMRFGPRALDLDLLLFGSELSNHEFCTLPHPRMLRRAFVLVPLQDVATQDMLPVGFSIKQALCQLPHVVQGRKIYQSS